MINKDRFNKEIARIFSPTARIERMRRKKISQPAPGNSPQTTDLTKIRIIGEDYKPIPDTKPPDSADVRTGCEPIRNVKFFTLALPAAVISGTDIPDLSTAENLKISFPDFEVLGIEGPRLPSKENLAALLREIFDLLNTNQISDLVDSVLAFEDGIVTVALSADNLSPVKLRISVNEFLEKITPFTMQIADTASVSDSNGDLPPDGIVQPIPPRVKAKYTGNAKRTHGRVPGNGENSRKGKLTGASFPDIEALGYKDIDPGDLTDVFKDWDRRDKNDHELAAFRTLFLTARKVRGTLTYSDGSTEPVEWTLAEYKKEYGERLSSLHKK